MSVRVQFEQHVREAVAQLVRRTIARAPITPNTLTVIGTLMTIATVPLISRGYFLAAGLALILTSVFDMLDGALARVTQRTSAFGAFLDSALDRYSDALLLFGFFMYFQHTAPGAVESTLTFLATIGTLLTSYMRARAEAVGFACKVGLVERPERMVLMILGLLSGWVAPMLWVLALLTNVTALQRLLHVWHSERSGHGAPRPNQR